MRVLLLSNTAGQGHNSTASAMMESLQEAGVECKMVDTYALISPILYEGLANGHLLSSSYAPKAYGSIYRMALKHNKAERKVSINRIANTLMGKKLEVLITDFAPDVIVSTHIFSALLADVMKANGATNATLIGIVTDFTLHPYWQQAVHTDYFVTVNELLTYQIVKRGIDPAKILPFGIPIHQKFIQSLDKKEARKQLEIEPDTFTVLLMSGSMGFGNLTSIVKSIDAVKTKLQLLVVCGNNKRAKRKIETIQTCQNVVCYGYVKNVEVMMDAADCLVSKPGGLTTSEALAKNLPMIIIDPMPGQEDLNAEFLLNNGLAMKVSKTMPFDEVLYQYLLYPEKTENMKSNIQLVRKPNSARDLVNFILRLKKE